MRCYFITTVGALIWYQTSGFRELNLWKKATKQPNFYIFMDYVAGCTFCRGLLYRCAPLEHWRNFESLYFLICCKTRFNLKLKAENFITLWLFVPKICNFKDSQEITKRPEFWPFLVPQLCLQILKITEMCCETKYLSIHLTDSNEKKKKKKILIKCKHFLILF